VLRERAASRNGLVERVGDGPFERVETAPQVLGFEALVPWDPTCIGLDPLTDGRSTSATDSSSRVVSGVVPPDQPRRLGPETEPGGAPGHAKKRLEPDPTIAPFTAIVQVLAEEE
jgi:hypothetical protein